MAKKCLKYLSLLLAVLFSWQCSPQVTDDTEFSLYYFDVGNMLAGEVINLTPSYIGTAPTDFKIYSITHNGNIFYNPMLDGDLTDKSPFYVEPVSGQFKMLNTQKLAVGEYKVSMTCTSAGVSYDYPDIITVQIVKEKK